MKASRHYSWYAAIFHKPTFYYFGGMDDYGNYDGIAGLDSGSWKWSFLGRLNTARYGHSVILVGIRFMIVGGEGSKDKGKT